MIYGSNVDVNGMVTDIEGQSEIVMVSFLSVSEMWKICIVYRNLPIM